MLIAQITDMHVGEVAETSRGTIDTLARLERAVAHIVDLRPAPDLVLATGDLTRDGAREEYAALRHVLSRLPMPYSLIPGNHDRREPLAAAFEDMPGFNGARDFLHHAIEGFPLRILALDTLDPGREGGARCARRLDWIEERLAEVRGRPTLIAMHHPPFAVGVPMFDNLGFEGGDAFGALVARHPEIEAIVCGHVHRAISLRWQGTAVHVTPATGYQYPLDMAAERVPRVDEPPACRLLHWLPETGLVAHLSYVD